MYKNILNYNCYASNNLCNSISFNKNGSCDRCFEKYSIKNINELNNNFLFLKENFIFTETNILFKNCEEELTKEAKALICLKIFNLLSKNLYIFFENNSKKLLINTINKCIEFKNNETKEILDKVLILNPEYQFSRDFIINVGNFGDNIKYNMFEDDKIFDDFYIFISNYMDNYIELNKINNFDLNKINNFDNEENIYYTYCDKNIKLDI